MIKEMATQKQSILLCVRCLSQKYIQHWTVTFLLCDSNDVINGAVHTSQYLYLKSDEYLNFLFDSADNLAMYTTAVDYRELKT